jgi:LPXTG-site transpeptidase (sortase) family protein
VLGAGLCLIAGLGIWAALGHSKHSDTALPANVLLPPAATATSATPASGRPSAAPSTATPSATAATVPVSIDIPAIHVHTTLQQLGLGADGALNPPTNLTQAGWYTGGPVPGANGPAVIAGHVDSTNGPAVFYNLKSLAPGDTVTVGLNSGQSVAFRVTAVQRYPKDDFPTEAVYGPRPDPELRLITCGGGFAAGHYLDNVVVYAAEQPAA